MKNKAKVVVVGGGVVGVSALYHLAKKGWSDVVLVERKELTSGSTWHAAGLLPLFNMSYSVGQLHKYAVNLYKTLEEETGKNVGFSVAQLKEAEFTVNALHAVHFNLAELKEAGSAADWKAAGSTRQRGLFTANKGSAAQSFGTACARVCLVGWRRLKW